MLIIICGKFRLRLVKPKAVYTVIVIVFFQFLPKKISRLRVRRVINDGIPLKIKTLH